MAAGTQGFTDTRLDTDHIGIVISKILEARKLAEDERKYAEAQAEKYQTSLEEAGISRGYFFKKALRWKFGGEYKEKKLSQLKTWKTKGKLLKTAVTGKAGQNKLNKFERAQAVFDMFQASDKPKSFRDKFKPLYEGYVDDPALRPQSKLVGPSSAEKFKPKTGSSDKKRVTKEDILNSIIGIAQAIEKVSESISEKNKIVADQMIHSSVLQGMIHQQLKTTGDSLDDKLQKLVDAISNQSQTQKKIIQKVSQSKAENKMEAQRDAASIVNFDDLLTKENESKIPATSAQDIEFQQMAMYEQNDVPKAETGAVFSGPDSGYLVELHGNEAVVPIDNNYTQGEPSAVDGKVRPKPNNIFSKSKTSITNNVQKFETGTKNNISNNISNNLSNNIFGSIPKYEKGDGTQSEVSSAPITSKFGFSTARNQMGIASGGTTQDSRLAQSMVDVMSLPMMAAGGALLSATTKYIESIGGDSANISPEIEKISRPIAKTFGLPSSIVSKAKQDSTAKAGKEKEEDKDEGKSKHDLFAKLTDGFGKLLEKLGDNINNTTRPTITPGPGSGGVTTTGEKGVLDLIASVEQGPEGYDSFNQSGGKTEGKATEKTIGWLAANAQGAIGRYQQMPQYLLERAKRAGFDENTKFTPEVQDAITLNELRTSHGLNEFLAGKITEEQFLQKISATWRGLPQGQTNAAKLGGSADMTYQDRYAGRNAAHKSYSTAISELTKIRAGNKPTLTSTTPPSSSPAAQLGQAITSNYGLKVGEERQFTHPTYGIIKAHKTAVGFDFYKGMTKLDVSPSNAQGKSIIDYFVSTNGGTQPFKPPASNENSSQKISSVSSKSKSESNQIAMLNINAGQKSSTAGSTPQVSGHDGTESGINPTRDFYNNPYSIGVG